jgi:hypothetical protein
VVGQHINGNLKETIMASIIKLTLKSLKKNGGICHGMLSIQYGDEYIISASGLVFSDEKATVICNDLRNKKTFNKNYTLVNATMQQI